MHRDPNYMSNKELLQRYRYLIIEIQQHRFENEHKRAQKMAEEAMTLEEEIEKRLNEVWRRPKDDKKDNL